MKKPITTKRTPKPTASSDPMEVGGVPKKVVAPKIKASPSGLKEALKATARKLTGKAMKTEVINRETYVDGTYSKESYLVVARKIKKGAKVSVRYISGELRVHLHPSAQDWPEIQTLGNPIAQRQGHTSYRLEPSKLTKLVNELSEVRSTAVMDSKAVRKALDIPVMGRGN